MAPWPPGPRQSVSSFLAPTATTIAATLPNPVLPGSLIVVRGDWLHATATGTPSGNSNVFAVAVARFAIAAGSDGMQVWYVKSAVAGSTTITLTFSLTSTNRLIEVFEYTGMDAANPFVNEAHNQASSGTALSTTAVVLPGQGFYTQHCYVGTAVTSMGVFTTRESAGSNNGGDLLNQVSGASVAGGATQTSTSLWGIAVCAWRYAGPPSIPMLRQPSTALIRPSVW